jgi:UDP-N-acetylglucosamine 2-epimerase
MRVLTILGTRPEAIKLAPVVHALNRHPGVVHACCVTGQHREMLDPLLALFDIVPEIDLALMQPGQDLAHITSTALNGITGAIDRFLPDWVIVQGDTGTAFAGALAAFYRKIPVAHVEAGLRTGDIHSPWPEEANRLMIGRLATLHFPPTARAAGNLLAEGIAADAMLVTGNTAIDALRWMLGRLDADAELQDACARRFGFLDPAKRLILVTGHRRENLDGGLQRVCEALRSVARRGDVEILYPMHLSPRVQALVRDRLSGSAAVHLVDPQDYPFFAYLMRRAYLIVTDSGGIQEEAPTLGRPVLVTRDTTERPEAVEAGTARLVGTGTSALTAAIANLLDDPIAYRCMAQARNPFGDGRAAERIVDRLVENATGRRPVIKKAG